MDVYTRQLIVRSRQGDLLREATEARLASEVRLATRVAPHRAFVARVGSFTLRPLTAIRAKRADLRPELAAPSPATVMPEAGLRG